MMVSDLVLRTMRGRFVDLASSRADVKLSAFIMERVLGMRMEQRPTSAGSFASNLRSFESVRDFIGSATVVAFIDLPFSVIFVVAIGWISWLMLVPLFVGGAVMVLYALAVQGRMHELAETTYRAGAQRNATLIEGLVGFETIKAIAAEAPNSTKVGKKRRTARSCWSAVAAFVHHSQQHIRVCPAVHQSGHRCHGGLPDLRASNSPWVD
jgi:ATP-binding cassette subfamily C protein LapB